jgi:hypothetical protein
LAFGQSIVDHGTRKAQAFFVTLNSTDRKAGFNAMLVGIGETDFFEDAVNGRFDLLDICWSQWFVMSTSLTGMNRFYVFGQCSFA